MNEPITPEQLAQSVHEQLRRSGVAVHDLPWIMCPTEYQFRMQEAARRILVELHLIDQEESATEAEYGYECGRFDGRGFNEEAYLEGFAIGCEQKDEEDE